MKIEFFVPGIARTAGSKTAFKNPKTGKVIVTHAGKYSKQWMDMVKFFAMQVANKMCLLEGPIRLTLEFYKERSKSHFKARGGEPTDILKDSAPKFPTMKPDLTKLTRAVEDAVTKIIWKDDAQVVEQYTFKAYCDNKQKPGVMIRIATID
jgi:Holliday junction resolvase RusA-like endonuclease